MLKKPTLIVAITIIYSIALATVSLIKFNNSPDIGVSFGDKIFHAVSYALLTFLWFMAFLYSFKLKKKQAIFFAVILSVIFGILIEVLQEAITDSRTLDVYDVVANTFGTLLISIVLWFKNNSHIKNT